MISSVSLLTPLCLQASFRILGRFSREFLFVFEVIYMYVCTYVCTYVCMYVRIYVCTYVCMYVCVYVCMYVCTYVCMLCHNSTASPDIILWILYGRRVDLLRRISVLLFDVTHFRRTIQCRGYVDANSVLVLALTRLQQKIQLICFHGFVTRNCATSDIPHYKFTLQKPTYE